jgi:apolipoprotein N-acyltransferase
VFVTSFIPFTNPYQIDDYVVAALGTDYEAYVRLAPEEQRVRQDNLIQAVADTLSQGVDYVILPEDARLSSSFDTPEAVFNFLTSFTDKDVVLVDPAMEWLDDGTKVVVALVYDTKTNSVEKIYKELLTPGGEYLSYFNGGILRLLGFSEALDNFNRMYGYKPWPNKTPLPEGVPEILFCFEGQSSVALWQKARRSGVPFVAHVVSHSWFKDSKILRHELDQMLRVNSLFARTSVYQAANKSHSMRY